ncbi:MAG TPA: hypothetical protein VNA88_14440 [Candidatus Kapabacteria bacterium]|jgi:hypothetical protein|nr:hypothetical protein [Candidatus Kapabacteria bacterium]
MKILDWKGTKEPADDEIERDVAELRSLLAGLEEPAEPHPAYWQNFLVHVRNRVDDDRVRRRRWSPSVALTSLTAAALVVVVAVSGVLPLGERTPAQPGVIAIDRRDALRSDVVENPYSVDGVESLMLSNDEMQMLDAILDESPEAVLQAMVEGESL